MENRYRLLEEKYAADLENERRVANLRAMEAWGRLDSQFRPVTTRPIDRLSAPSPPAKAP